MDTAPSFSGKNINPRIVENYDGEDIVLNSQENIIMSPRDFPELKNYLGQDIIVTDGTTLLGADDKAGITEIITAMEHLIKNPDIKHGEIKVGFTPDEEIGKGADLFDVKKFGADYAYTIDGGEIGELEYENFNAASARIKINGRNIHPGTSKNKMINSLLLGMELNSMLPVSERPEYTENYEGFFLLCDMKGDVETTDMNYIIRDHQKEKFDEKKNLMKNSVDFLNKKYGAGIFELEIKDSYYNMKEKVEPVIEIVDIVKKSMEDIGINPIVKPIRGGTDGARLSYMGLPCPNIFTGGHNFHGKFEYIPVQSMEKSVEIIVKICQNYAENEFFLDKKDNF
jgi:tripeptide aminopeptidase